MSAPWAKPEEGCCIKYKWPLDGVKIALLNTSDLDVLASGWEPYGQLSWWLRVSNCCIKYKRYLVVAVLAEPEEGRCIKYKWLLDGVKIAVSNTSDSDVPASHSGWESYGQLPWWLRVSYCLPWHAKQKLFGIKADSEGREPFWRPLRGHMHLSSTANPLHWHICAVESSCTHMTFESFRHGASVWPRPFRDMKILSFISLALCLTSLWSQRWWAFHSLPSIFVVWLHVCRVFRVNSSIYYCYNCYNKKPDYAR